MSMGWECPVCHKGNAPAAMKCGHCADAERRAEASGKKQHQRENAPSSQHVTFFEALSA